MADEPSIDATGDIATQGQSTDNALRPDLGRLKRMFDDSRNLTQEERDEAQRDWDYYDGNQLTAAEIRALRKRKQPEIVTNRVRPAVNGFLGVMVQGKSDPRAYLRNPQPPKPPTPPQLPVGSPPPVAGSQPPAGPAPAPQGASAPSSNEDAGDVATKVLRYVADTTRFDRTKLACFRDNLITGRQAVIVECAGPDQEIKVNDIRWEEFFYDPRSRRHDFADARYKGVAKWVYMDQLKAMYAGVESASGPLTSLDTYLTGGNLGGDWTWEDKPDVASPWIDREQRRVMVVEIYHQETDGWHKSVFFAGGVLETSISPYQDSDGTPYCPIVAMSCYVDRKNRRHGVVRDMRSIQDEVNMRRSKSLHAANSRQLQERELGAATTDADEARAEAARPDGVIPPGWQVVPTNDMLAGNIQLLQEAKSEIERIGPNPAILGRQGADASGRAVLARQEAGLTEFAIILDQQQDWELRVHRHVWSAARQFWTAPKWIRVTNDVGAPEFIQINVPGPPVVDPMTGQMVPGPPISNSIAQIDVDIVLDAVPDTATLQQEQFNEMLRLLSANPQYAASVPFPIVLKMSSVANKSELLDEIEQFQAQAAQTPQAQFQEIMQHLQMLTEQAKIQKTQADTAKSMAQAGHADALASTEEVTGKLLPFQPPPGSPGANGMLGAASSQAGPPLIGR